MSSVRRVLLNAGWNLAGNVLPLIAAAALLPYIIERIGIARFGLLSLAWVLIGYFSLFDLGLGRAITRMIAARSESLQSTDVSSICSTGLAVLGLLGLVGAAIVGATALLPTHDLLALPTDLHRETTRSIHLIALSIPLVVATSGLRGILEGFQKFKILNSIRIPAGILLFAAPAIAATISPRLDVTILSLLLTRVAILVAHIQPCLKHVSISRRLVSRRWIKSMLIFGGWLTVSNVVGPLIVYMDRFVIGITGSVEAIAFYSAPFEVVSRLLVIPAALTAALFPAMVSLHEHSAAQAKRMRRLSTRLVALVVFPVCTAALFVAEPALSLWLGPSFAANSTLALQLLLPGFALNSLAQVAATALLSLGKARTVAVLYLAQLPIYSIVLYSLTLNYGIAGAASAWSARAALDCAASFLILRSAEAANRPVAARGIAS